MTCNMSSAPLGLVVRDGWDVPVWPPSGAVHMSVPTFASMASMMSSGFLQSRPGRQVDYTGRHLYLNIRDMYLHNFRMWSLEGSCRVLLVAVKPCSCMDLHGGHMA